MKKTTLVAGLLVLTVIGTLGAVSLTKVYAEDSVQTKTLLQTIVEKFNLNSEEVQKIVDEYRSERSSDRKQELAEKLDYLVYKEKITDDQKSKILAKYDEVKDKMNEFWKLSVEERKTKLDELRDELESWAESNNIDTKYVFMLGMGGGKMGKGHGEGAMMGGFGNDL